MSRARTSLVTQDELRFMAEDDNDGYELLGQMAGVFRWNADGSMWAARVANSHAHGFGATPHQAMLAAVAATQPKKRVPLL